MTFPILPSNSAVGGYQVQRSLRFNSADSAYLNRTPSVAGNRRTWTFSCWVKSSYIPTGVGEWYSLFSAGVSDTATPSVYIQMVSAGARIALFTSGGYDGYYFTSSQFRDLSAWYNFVFVVDTTQSNASDRLKIYVNNLLDTGGINIYPSQNYDTGVNLNQSHYIGASPYTTGVVTAFAKAYMTEVNFIDGQALTPSSFGETNATTGQWQPKRYTGTYGTNGFYLNFSDNSGTTATTLGKDYSGNGNNWTPNNFSVTPGAGNDSMIDVPTNWADGGNGRGNYCTLNPLDKNTNIALANGNLDVSLVSATNLWYAVRSTIGVTSGKWYFEATLTATNYFGIGFYNAATALDGGYNDIYSTTSGAVLACAFDADAGTVTTYLNNVAQSTVTGKTSGPYFPYVSVYGSASGVLNFGQRPFAYTPPSGFKALNTQNLPSPTIAKGGQHFNAVLYTGNGSTQSITGVGFRPDFIWLKARSAGYQHGLFDVVRGTGQGLVSNNTTAETAYAAVTSFNTDGFTNGVDYNDNATTYVAWNWKANGTGVTNTAGSITSTVSANTTSGFAVVTYTGTGANATVGHGLGVAPRMVIVKSRTQGTTGYTGNWAVWHTAIANTEYLLLNTTDAKATGANYWNSTTPTSSVFSIGTAGLVNTNTHNFVAYCFAAIPGYSAFGSYTGNGSADGPFVYTGFRPAYVLIKMSSSTGNWVALDKSRLGYNVDNNPLYPNLADAEATTDLIDILSNGFKIRSTDASVNTSSGTYIYAAFAESPFKYANAR